MQQLLGLLAALAAEVGVQQVDHRPEVTALLDVDLEQVAQVVEARARSRRGCAAARPTRARCRPGSRSAAAGRRGTRPAPSATPGSPLCSPKAIAAVAVALGEEDAPAVVLHRDVAEVRPALAADVDRGAQVDVLGRQRRAHRLPPVEEVGLPRLQRPLQPAVLVQLDVVRDLLACSRWQWSSLRLASGRSRPAGRCRTCAAPRPGRRRWAG